MLRRKKLGQSTAEYAIVIALVIAAAMAMQTYVKRGIQGKVKAVVDNRLAAGQYEPYYAKHNIITTSTSGEHAVTSLGGGVTRTLAGEGEKTTREQGEGASAETTEGTGDAD